MAAGDTMQGCRAAEAPSTPGAYALSATRRVLLYCLPNAARGWARVEEGEHTIGVPFSAKDPARFIEHADGTLTLSPGLYGTQNGALWRGYLERGVWREA